MGVFVPSCVATDNIRFFAFAAVAADGGSTLTHYLLVQSNDKPPSSLVSLTWRLLSAVPMTGLPYMVPWLGTTRLICTVDEEGVFSVLLNDLVSGLNGLQFQPALVNNSSGLQNGTWKNITIPSDYNWNDDSPSAFFSTKDSLGKKTLIHAYFSRLSSSVNVAELDTSTMAMKKNPTPWKPSLRTSYFMVIVAHLKDALYTLGTDYQTQGIYSMAFNGSTDPPATAPQVVITTEFSTYCGSSLLDIEMRPLSDNQMAVVCLNPDPAELFIFDGTKITRLPQVQNVPRRYELLSTVPFSAGSDPFIFMHGSQGIYSIPLSGNYISKLIRATNFSISEDFESPTHAPHVSTLPSPIDGPGGTGGKGNTHGGLIGGMAALVVASLISAVLLLFARRRKVQRKREASKEVAEDECMILIGSTNDFQTSRTSPDLEGPEEQTVVERQPTNVDQELYPVDTVITPTYPQPALLEVKHSFLSESPDPQQLTTDTPKGSRAPSLMSRPHLHHHHESLEVKHSFLSESPNPQTTGNFMTLRSVGAESISAPLEEYALETLVITPMRTRELTDRLRNGKDANTTTTTVSRLHPQTTPIAYNAVPPAHSWLTQLPNAPHTNSIE
ncbi:hypothetical protein EDD11_009258 [Mortierella claussenii]|nr:hypothetical protein EDD11_009258 [Mortierella claussenii]